jgi:N-acetyltransferase 10
MRRNRYEVATDAPGWAQAEAEVLKATKKGAKPSAISVKTLKAKRKAGESAAEIYEEELGEKKRDRGHKKAKTSGKKH